MIAFKVGDRVRLIELPEDYKQDGLTVGEQTGIVVRATSDPIGVNWRGFTNGHSGESDDDDNTSHWYVPASCLEKVPFAVGDRVRVVGPDQLGAEGTIERHDGNDFIPWLIRLDGGDTGWFRADELVLIGTEEEVGVSTRTIVDLAEEYTGRYITVDVNDKDTIVSEWDTRQEAFDEALEAAKLRRALFVYEMVAAFEFEMPEPTPTITIVTQA